MKIFGYPKQILNEHGLFELEEITFQAKANVLKEIAEFLIETAQSIEENDANFEHVHLQDTWDNWKEDYPDIIVAKQ